MEWIPDWIAVAGFVISFLGITAAVYCTLFGCNRSTRIPDKCEKCKTQNIRIKHGSTFMYYTCDECNNMRILSTNKSDHGRKENNVHGK